MLKTESHMRFHLVAGLYAIGFCAKFYDLTPASWGVLILTISAVFVTEIFNTVLERVCDTVTTEYNKNIEFIKDVSAGAVLVTAISSVVIAFLMLYDVEIFKNILYHFTHDIVDSILLVIGTAISLAFIIVKPERYLPLLKRKK